jgi:hypothetical protein
MQLTPLMLAILLGFLLPGVSMIFVKLLVNKINDGDQIESSTHTLCILTFIYGFTGISTFLWMMRTDEILLVSQGLLTILIMSMIAYHDTLSGRIPILFFLVAAIMGSIFSALADNFPLFLIGLFVNLGIGLIIYFLGGKYANNQVGFDNKNNAFGLGDVYAAGIIGALIGFPLSILGLVFGLVFSVLFAIIQSLVEKTPVMSLHVRMGPGFLIATVLMLFLFL